jgi:multicomponent Na+:H+ antiporter subunit B
MSGPGELTDAEPRHRPRVGALVVCAVAAVLVVALVDLPREGARLSAVAHQALSVAVPQWHTTEPVNEVVYGTRGFDTFGETFLLLAAVMSVVVLARRREPRRGFVGEEREGSEEERSMPAAAAPDAGQQAAREAEAAEDELDRTDRPETPDKEPVGTLGQETSHSMTVVTRTAARIAAPLLAIAGCYLCAWGYTPGGGFPGGAVILGVVLLLYAGYGYPRISKVVRPAVVELIEIAGALVIVVTEVLGLVVKGSISQNWLPLAPVETIRAGGVTQVFSGSELIEVATGLVIAIFTLLGMRHDWTADAASGDDS